MCEYYINANQEPSSIEELRSEAQKKKSNYDDNILTICIMEKLILQLTLKEYEKLTNLRQECAEYKTYMESKGLTVNDEEYPYPADSE